MARASDIFLKRSRAKTAKAWLTIRGVKFRVNSAMSEAYQKAVNAPGHDEDDDYYTKCVSKNLLIDWKNLDNDDGTPMECNEEAKFSLLKTYTEIGTRIISFAADPSNFIEANFIEEEVGNS